jgi:hypothetical protein
MSAKANTRKPEQANKSLALAKRFAEEKSGWVHADWGSPKPENDRRAGAKIDSRKTAAIETQARRKGAASVQEQNLSTLGGEQKEESICRTGSALS